MDCCGHGHAIVPQHGLWSMAVPSVGAMLAGSAGPRGSTAAARTAETASAALAVLRKSISVDVHTHGGKTGIMSQAPPSHDLRNPRSKMMGHPGVENAFGQGLLQVGLTSSNASRECPLFWGSLAAAKVGSYRPDQPPWRPLAARAMWVKRSPGALLPREP